MGCGSCGKKYSQQKQEEKKAKVAAHLEGDSMPSSFIKPRRYKISIPAAKKKDA